MADEMTTRAGVSRADAKERFAEVTGPHLEVLLRVARSMSSDLPDAEDLVQDTLLRAFRAIESFDGRYPRAWLLTIMRNANRNRHRRQRPGLLRDDTTAEIDVRNPPAPSAEAVATAALCSPEIIAALEHLTPRLRRVVELVDIDGLSYNECAAILALPAGTVMSRLHRARRRIRDRLEHDPQFRSAHP